MSVNGRITRFVLAYSLKVAMCDDTLFKALDMAADLEKEHQFFISGKSSSGMAAAIIWLSSILCDDRIFQRQLTWVLCDGAVCRVTDSTLRNLAHRIAPELGLANLTPAYCRACGRIMQFFDDLTFGSYGSGDGRHMVGSCGYRNCVEFAQRQQFVRGD